MAKDADQFAIPDQLREACARNAPLELHRSTAKGTEPVARGRLLAIKDDRLYIEKPQAIGKDLDLGMGQEFRAFFIIGDLLLFFETFIVDPICVLKLNKEKIIHGVALAAPSRLQQGQRREFFRTSLACQAPISVRLHETNPAHPTHCPINARRFEGQIVDASGGGVGVVLEETPRRLRVNGHYFATFQLPDVDDELVFLVEARQLRPIRDETAVRIGFMFVPWPTPFDLTRKIEPLIRYLTVVQRNLKRSA